MYSPWSHLADQLAIFVTSHLTSQAKEKERAERLLTRLEAQFPAEKLEKIHQRSWGSELDLWETAEKLLVELEELGWGSADQKVDHAESIPEQNAE